MDVSVAEQMLDELLPSLEALEAQSGAIVQFLRDKGIATDEQLAPFLERARSASNVRWLAVRLRMNRLLAPAVKTGEETKKTMENMKEEPAERAQKPTQEAGNLQGSVIQFECDSCGKVKKPTGIWILGRAAKAVGRDHIFATESS